MKILFVAMVNSVHTQRWVEHICQQGWDIHIFPVEAQRVHEDIHDVTVHDLVYQRSRRELKRASLSVKLDGLYWRWLKYLRKIPLGTQVIKVLMSSIRPQWSSRAWRLAQTVKHLQPNIIHSLEMQHAGYLTMEAREILKQGNASFSFPTWIVSNWGSDIYLFGQLPEHATKIRAMLQVCTHYLCECQRDVELGRQFGFQGHVLPVLPVAGGHDLKRMRQLRELGPRSEKKLIMLKGYQNWAGRALTALLALELCTDLLREKQYEIAIYLYYDDVKLAAELVSLRTGIPIHLIPYGPHDEILKLHGRARISIGLSISDAISTSFLEAIMMGSFPIQSNTSCCNEWIENGKTGMIVPAEDQNLIAEAIRIALTDDELVNRATEINDRTVNERLDFDIVQPQVVSLYQQVFSHTKP